ncbi:ArgK protein-domain-containing protein [Paraphysoderma sedebokerense]|nr:ArgK protein-domain-containing protein [Paraphysoderma sedebokerense]
MIKYRSMISSFFRSSSLLGQLKTPLLQNLQYPNRVQGLRALRTRIGYKANTVGFSKRWYSAGHDIQHDIVTENIFQGLVKGDRMSLAKAITLVESTNPTHKKNAQWLLSQILNHLKKIHPAAYYNPTMPRLRRAPSTHSHPGAVPNLPSASGSKGFEKRKDLSVDHDLDGDIKLLSKLPTTFRIGMSGSPGVGKSTFIESLGMWLVNRGMKVAVLAVDPSSSRTGGSILGDKTRMIELSRHPNAYVRPSPSRGTLGGVARATSEAILICEAAGYDIILVETVGVGQSETMVADMVDMFVLLVPPAGGDELQGIKKGIVEMSDLILVNKSDGPLEGPSRIAQMEYLSALKFVQPGESGWKPQVMRVSALQKRGLTDVWNMLMEYYNSVLNSSQLESKRSLQRKTWMWRLIMEELQQRLRSNPTVQHTVQQLEKSVLLGDETPGVAADDVVDKFLKSYSAGSGNGENHNRYSKL